MVGAPFLYEAEKFNDTRFPTTTFDPKAVTRASFQVQRPKPKPDGPLVSINRHPDAHEAPPRRAMYWKPMTGQTKWWIKAMRVVQLVLRVLELIAAAGVLVLFILMNHVDGLTAWVMRITAGVVCLHSVYAIYHLVRPAGGRTPGSSGAYHSFAALSDICVIPLYAFGALASRNNSSEWSTLLSNASQIEYFVPATYYTLIGAGSAHVLSLVLSVWLALMFRRIHKMPPDMNPLEAHLTSRAHKRNKSSVATMSTYSDSIEKRLSTPLSQHRRSGAPYENVSLSRPPSIPFMHTRQGSETSLRTRDSRADLPSRQYQILPANTSPRNSAGSAELKRMSGTPTVPARSSWRNSYAEVPGQDIVPGSNSPRNSTHNPNSRPGTAHHTSRPSTGTAASYRTAATHTGPPTPPAHNPQSRTTTTREPRFTEAWYASESLIARTNARQKSLDKLNGSNPNLPMPGIQKSYEALDQRYDDDAQSMSAYSDDENVKRYRRGQEESSELDSDSEEEDDLGSRTPKMQPIHPLRSNPTTPTLAPRAKTPFGPAINITKNSPGKNSPRALANIDLNDRRVSGSHDIADERYGLQESAMGTKALNRKSSIQPESEFFAKPYGGTLKPGTPPVLMVGSNRQVSSGYDDGKSGGLGSRFSVFGRRNVSGKVVEEGRGGQGLWENYT